MTLTLEQIHCVEWMHPKTAVRGDMLIADAARLMADKDIGCVLVSVDGKEVGMVTERDILKRVVAKGLDPTSTRVDQVQSEPLVTVDEEATLEDAANLMAQNRIRRLPVVNKKDEIIGIVSTRTISYALARSREDRGPSRAKN